MTAPRPSLRAVPAPPSRTGGRLVDGPVARTLAAQAAPLVAGILASIGFKPPEPGFLEVKQPERADTTVPVAISKDRAVLVILDASGSMLKKFGMIQAADVDEGPVEISRHHVHAGDTRAKGAMATPFRQGRERV